MPVVVKYYDKEKTIISARYVTNEAGEKDGLYEYYLDGKLYESVMYVAGKKEGIQRYFSKDGREKSNYTYVHDVLNGPFFEESEGEDSTTSRRGTYKDGELDGEYHESRHYRGGAWMDSWSGSSSKSLIYKDGKIFSGSEHESDYSSGTFHRSNRERRTYYENGRKVSYRADGYHTDDGNWFRNIDYTYDDEGTHVHEHKDYSKHSERHIDITYTEDADGKKNGWYIERSSQKDERIQYSHGKKDGIWISWNSVSFYKDDKPADGKIDYKSEDLIIKGKCQVRVVHESYGDYERSQFSGTIKRPAEDGKWNTLTYRDDEREGPAEMWESY